ncbi:MAG: VOC family protein [Reichenbachiella sp.]
MIKNIFLRVSLLVSITLLYTNKSKAQEFTFTFDHYAINVLDLEQSVSFYQKFFFVEEIYDGTEKDFIRWFSLGNNQELHIIENKDLIKDIPKGVHIALTTIDLDAYIMLLEKNNIKYYDWPGKESSFSTRPDQIRQIYIQDPDSYWIEINNGIKRYSPTK